MLLQKIHEIHDFCSIMTVPHMIGPLHVMFPKRGHMPHDHS